MKLVALLAGCLISAPLCALEQVGNVVTLSDDEMSQCDSGGGCTVAPKELIREMIRGAYITGLHECRNAT